MTLCWRLAAGGLGVVVAFAIDASMQGPVRATEVAGYANDLEVGHIVDLVNSDKDDFAGVAGDKTGNGLAVYVVAGRAQQASTLSVLASIQDGLSPTTADVTPKTSKTWSVYFAAATYSLRDLDSVLSEIPAKQPWAASALPT